MEYDLNIAEKSAVNQNKTYKAFFYLTFIFMTNFILKPVRDQLILIHLLDQIEWLFFFSFLFTLILVPTISLLLTTISLTKFTKVLHFSYGLFLIVISHYLSINITTNIQIIILIISSNFFNLLFISLFWNQLTDIYQENEALKSFVFIATGATIGSLLGPIILLLFSNNFSTSYYLMLAGILNLALPFLLNFNHQRIKKHFIIPKTKKSYLGNLSGSIIIYTAISSFLYVIIAHEIKFHDLLSSHAIQVFAIRDLLINFITLLIQVVIAKEWIKIKFPYGFISMPVLTFILFGCAFLFPSLFFLIGFQVMQKSGNRSLIKPANEILFTAYYHKYKLGIKNFIDMVIYRIGDLIGVCLFFLIGYLGMPNASISVIGGLLSLCWLFYNYKIAQSKNNYSYVK